MEVSSIQSGMISPQERPGSVPLSQAPSFAQLLQGAVEAVDETQHNANTAARDFAIGEAQSLHDTMITVEKADISLRLLTQVRNKAVEAYQEIMRMQV